MGEPSDFGENEAAGHGNKTGVVLAVLDKEVVGGGVTDEETSNDEDRGIGNGGENRGGGSAEEDGSEGLDDSKDLGGTGFNQDEPDGVADDERDMNGENGGAGGVGEENETGTDDEVNEARADIEQPIAVVDGENPPFRDHNENETDEVVSGNKRSTDGGDRQ